MDSLAALPVQKLKIPANLQTIAAQTTLLVRQQLKNLVKGGTTECKLFTGQPLKLPELPVHTSGSSLSFVPARRPVQEQIQPEVPAQDEEAKSVPPTIVKIETPVVQVKKEDSVPESEEPLENKPEQPIRKSRQPRSDKKKKAPQRRERRKHCERWTHEEDILLEKAVTEIGEKNWNEISIKVGTKSPDQCNQHWFRVLNPKISKKPWTEEEDKVLMDKVEAFGTSSWKRVSEALVGRTDIQCRHRYIMLSKGTKGKRRRPRNAKNADSSEQERPSKKRRTGTKGKAAAPKRKYTRKQKKEEVEDSATESSEEDEEPEDADENEEEDVQEDSKLDKTDKAAISIAIDDADSDTEFAEFGENKSKDNFTDLQLNVIPVSPAAESEDGGDKLDAEIDGDFTFASLEEKFTARFGRDSMAVEENPSGLDEKLWAVIKEFDINPKDIFKTEERNSSIGLISTPSDEIEIKQENPFSTGIKEEISFNLDFETEQKGENNNNTFEFDIEAKGFLISPASRQNSPRDGYSNNFDFFNFNSEESEKPKEPKMDYLTVPASDCNIQCEDFLACSSSPKLHPFSIENTELEDKPNLTIKIPRPLSPSTDEFACEEQNVF